MFRCKYAMETKIILVMLMLPAEKKIEIHYTYIVSTKLWVYILSTKKRR